MIGIKKTFGGAGVQPTGNAVTLEKFSCNHQQRCVRRKQQMLHQQRIGLDNPKSFNLDNPEIS